MSISQSKFIVLSKKRLVKILEKIPILSVLIAQKKKKLIDTYIVSFPKCGRTWLRLMIGWIIVRHFNLTNFQNLKIVLQLEGLDKFHPNIPKIRLEHDDDAFFKRPDELTKSKTEYKYTKVIFLVRDPRDVIVSSYFHKRKRYNFKPKDKSKQIYASYQGEISDFLREQVGSFETLIRYYNIWAANRHIPKDFLLVRYEALSTNTFKELQRVLDFIGLSGVDCSLVEEAVRFCSFDNMHQMEAENKFSSDLLKPTNKADSESYKTRKGKVRGFIDYLSEEDIEYLNCRMQETLSDFYQYQYW